MTRGRAIAYGAVIAVLVAFPLAVIAWNEQKLRSGQEVTLRTEPVDPIDFFRGNYVDLNYEISTVAHGNAGPGSTVYVVLTDAGDYWEAERASAEKPSSGQFIRGTVTSGGPIRYGIETYFASEQKAKQYERAAANGNLLVDVVLDDDGGAKIRRLRVEGEG